MDFVISNTLTEGQSQAFIIWIVLLSVLFLISAPIAIFGGGGKSDVTPSFLISLFLSLLSMIALIFVALNFGNKVTGGDVSYDTKKFQSWAAEEYMLELDKDQVNELMNNTVSNGDTRPPVPVRVEIFNGKDAMAYLFNNNKEWDIIVLESAVIPTK
jgi:hypothetical protein